jgi:hypothetical protein
MAFRVGTANGSLDMLLMLKRFVESAKMVTNIVYTPAGADKGYLSAEGAADAAVDETWTITFTSATEFTVTGSVSGLQTATGTVGTEYTNDASTVYFKVIVGLVAWTAGDTIAFDIATGLGAEKWTVNRYADAAAGAPNKQLLLKGFGTAGYEVFVGIEQYRTSATVQGWNLAGFTAFNGSATFATQPGNQAGYYPRTIFQDRESPYWICANGRRIIMCYEVNTIYEWVHLGLGLPYGLPNENPYPLIIGGSTSRNDIAIDSRTPEHSAFWCHVTDGISGLTQSTAGKVWDGSWLPMFNQWESNDLYRDQYGAYDVFRTWPYSVAHKSIDSYEEYAQFFMTQLRKNYDGTYPLFPVIVWKGRVAKRTLCQLQGLYAIPGDGVNAKDSFTIDGKTYIVLPNTYYRGTNHWAALKLE